MLGAERSVALDMHVDAEPPAPARPRRRLFGRTGNRHVVIQRRAPLLLVADGLGAIGRGLMVVLRVAGKLVLALGITAGILWGGRLAVRHVMASPRFALREIQVSPTAHLPRDEVLELAQVDEGDRLLEIDTDKVAKRVAAHPWVAAVRVRRQLPGQLSFEITERRAGAVAAMGNLYLVDEKGHPFKRATMDEADGLPVLTGVDRARYAEHREATEAVFREALALLAEYGRAAAGRPARPALSELNVDTRFGFTLFLLDGGAELRLGRGPFSKKLARLDQIFEAVKVNGPAGLANLRVVHLDHLEGAGDERVVVGLAQRQGQENNKD